MIEVNGSKYDNILVILSEIQEFPSTDWKKSTPSSLKFTSRFLLWWRKTPWQYKAEKKNFDEQKAMKFCNCYL